MLIFQVQVEPQASSTNLTALDPAQPVTTGKKFKTFSNQGDVFKLM